MSYQPNQREKDALRRKGKATPMPQYTGLVPVNTQRFIQPKPVQPTSSTATIRRPDQQQQGTGSPGVDTLAGLQKGYEETTSAYNKGQNAKEWWNSAGDSGLSPQERLEDTYGMFRDFATGEDSYSNAEMFSSRMANANRGMEGMPTQFDGFNTGFERPPPVPNNGLYANSPTPGASVLPDGFMGFGPKGGGQMITPSTGVSGLNAPPSVGAFTTGLPPDLSSVSLTAPTDAASTLSMGGLGGEVAAEGSAASSGSGSMAGKVGAGAGVAFNAYDMSQNGINAGNAMGLVGSGILLTVGAANAWNPVGWALLAGSAAYSLFG